MPRKKKEELEAEGNAAEVGQEESADDAAVEASADENATDENATHDKPKRTRKAKTDDNAAEDAGEEPSVISSVFETVSSVVGSVASSVAGGVSSVVSAITGDDSSKEEAAKSHHSKRAERIGIVQSDKMTKTVTVRVDRQVKHPIYRKYIKRRKNFMAHDELGAGIGDKVRILETRPMSARKRWRVVEIIQKAVK